jgi:hypothetical protein
MSPALVAEKECVIRRQAHNKGAKKEAPFQNLHYIFQFQPLQTAELLLQYNNLFLRVNGVALNKLHAWSEPQIAWT